MADDRREQPGMPEPVAVIDIGSNSLRMVVAQVHPDGRTEVLEQMARSVRLGHDSFLTGRLSQEAMSAALTVLRDYRRVLDTYGVKNVRAVATSALREAANTDALLDRIARTVDLDVDVLEPAEQSMLIISAVRNDIAEVADLKRRHVLVAEVGGGSTLLTVLRSGEIAGSQSYTLGSIRMQESLATSQEPQARVAELLRHYIAGTVDQARKALRLRAIRTVVAIGGDARFAAAQVGEAVGSGGLRAVESARLDKLVDRCAALAPQELSRAYGVSFADAETLLPALLVYQALLHATRADRMVVSQVSMRDGLLADLPRYVAGREDPAMTQNILVAAKALAARYQCDLGHADHVAQLAVRLFDELQSEHRLPPRNRLLLQVAALLHEVGGFVNSRAHHRHSYYLISNSEVFGLQRKDLSIVAHVARYHRRGVPASSHLEYTALPRDQRMVVNKLAALLRVADALDNGHSGRLCDAGLERRGQELVVYARDIPDLALERRALADKSDLFEDVYGFKVRLEPSLSS